MLSTTSAQQCPYAPVEDGDAEAARADRAESNGGKPTLAFDQNTPYVDYVGIDTLLSLQNPRTKEPAESAFIITTQVMELLFALVQERWEAARDAMEDDDVPGAVAWLRSACNAQDVLNSSWALLGDMTPTQFNRFRDAFGEASGFQSYSYRKLEFLLGNKSAAMIRPHKAMSGVVTELTTLLERPSLYDAALRLLHRRGLPVPDSSIERDWTADYEPSAEVEQAWIGVYSDDRPGNELFLLAEALVDVAERVTRWRQLHLVAVKRTMGGKPGSGGSNGLNWLARNAEQDVFPELWSLRSTI
ncbi:tryptophan 2,3-dioxygenase [Nocardiopsis terrae]|uniref:Tryptophan 2,3-dioxygenase n=1 Tax=Nocardiopsis terrae TaxID=372655 RepID=A0ABR9HJU8_9ACTN|nr:tryptophan 2,3-dioxygenase family protein [Nocardiopsis terrae]MBE1459278.1 tryptophan 2,3-dioxygenase [Nocardiopsis terrae]GHC89070.1 tryptophan 2,3-dioxygenase [Nocardiopsis terrae]